MELQWWMKRAEWRDSSFTFSVKSGLWATMTTTYIAGVFDSTRVIDRLDFCEIEFDVSKTFDLLHQNR